MVQQGKLLYMPTKNCVKDVLRKYQEKYRLLAKENLLLCPKKKPELDDTPFVDEVNHKEYQHIIGVCQWLIVAGRFDLIHVEKYPKQGYAINPMPLKLDMEYEKVEIN
eukprot:440940-Ditylum_brightwellii.AAC.1